MSSHFAAKWRNWLITSSFELFEGGHRAGSSNERDELPGKLQKLQEVTFQAYVA